MGDAKAGGGDDGGGIEGLPNLGECGARGGGEGAEGWDLGMDFGGVAETEDRDGCGGEFEEDVVDRGVRVGGEEDGFAL